jgi:hypothetical protein
MTNEQLDELYLAEEQYARQIEAAPQAAKAGLEKLKGFISDKIDHELFDRGNMIEQVASE